MDRSKWILIAVLLIIAPLSSAAEDELKIPPTEGAEVLSVPVSDPSNTIPVSDPSKMPPSKWTKIGEKCISNCDEPSVASGGAKSSSAQAAEETWNPDEEFADILAQVKAKRARQRALRRVGPPSARAIHLEAELEEEGARLEAQAEFIRRIPIVTPHFLTDEDVRKQDEEFRKSKIGILLEQAKQAVEDGQRKAEEARRKSLVFDEKGSILADMGAVPLVSKISVSKGPKDSLKVTVSPVEYLSMPPTLEALDEQYTIRAERGTKYDWVFHLAAIQTPVAESSPKRDRGRFRLEIIRF